MYAYMDNIHAFTQMLFYIDFLHNQRFQIIYMFLIVSLLSISLLSLIQVTSGKSLSSAYYGLIGQGIVNLFSSVKMLQHSLRTSSSLSVWGSGVNKERCRYLIVILFSTIGCNYN